jgi:hypothetical protein
VPKSFPPIAEEEFIDTQSLLDVGAEIDDDIQVCY